MANIRVLSKEREELRLIAQSLKRDLEELPTSSQEQNKISELIKESNTELQKLLHETGHSSSKQALSNFIKSKHQLEIHTKHIQEYEKEIATIETKLDLVDKARVLLQATAEAKEYEIKACVESLVTQGLRAVFGRSDYRFVINLSVKRNRLNLDYWWEEALRGETVKIPLKAQSGGVVDVTVALLRIVFLSLFNDQSKFIILDEPFKHLSSEYLPSVATLLKKLRDMLDLQIILVTHKEELTHCGDKVFLVNKVNESTEIREI